MNFAMLAATATGGFGSYGMIVIIVVMVGAMYFLMWRPQKKKEKQAQELRNSIDVGDEVTTIGGIVGRVVSVKEDTFVIETAGERSRMRFKRWAIQEVGKLSLDTNVDSAAADVKSEKPKADKVEKKTTKSKKSGE